MKICFNENTNSNQNKDYIIRKPKLIIICLINVLIWGHILKSGAYCVVDYLDEVKERFADTYGWKAAKLPV